MKFLHSRPAESWTLSLGQFQFKKISSFLHRCCYFLFIAIEWMTRILTSTHELINVIDFAFKSNLINCLKNYARHYGSQEKIAKCETNKKSWQYKSNDSWTERWKKITIDDDINATRRHIIKSKHIDVKHSFSDYEVLSARARAWWPEEK